MLEIRAHRANKQLIPQEEQPRIQLYELVNDMEKSIKADYKDIAFEKAAYKASFWESKLKALATQLDYRQKQIDFIRSVMDMAQAAISDYESKPCENDEAHNTFYSQLSQQLTSALAVIGNEVSREVDNKFTSKLGKIVEHLMEKHDTSSNDANLEEGLVLLNQVMMPSENK